MKDILNLACIGFVLHRDEDLIRSITLLSKNIDEVVYPIVDHAYLEIQRQEALVASSEPDAHVTLGDIQRQLQSLSRRAEIARVFDFAQSGFELETIYQRLAA